MKRRICFVILLALCCCRSNQAKEPLDSYLQQARLHDALKVYQSWGGDPQTSFEGGLVEVLESLRHFSSSMGSYARDSAGLPLPAGPKKTISYPVFIKMFVELRDNLETASARLEKGGSGDWKVAFHPTRIRLDFNENGKADENEEIGALLSFGLSRSMTGANARPYEEMEIHADAADALWLAGYCRLVAAVLDVALVYDWQPLFNAFGRYVFEHVEEKSTPPNAYGALAVRAVSRESGEAARRNLLEVLRLSEATMNALEKEKDDDHEWIPSSTQHSVTGMDITAERWTGWKKFVGTMRSVLEGELLVDYNGSGAKGKGLNIKRLMQNMPATLGAAGVPLDEFLESAAAEKIVDEKNEAFRFMEGNGYMYALFIN